MNRAQQLVAALLEGSAKDFVKSQAPQEFHFALGGQELSLYIAVEAPNAEAAVILANRKLRELFPDGWMEIEKDKQTGVLYADGKITQDNLV